MSTPLEDMIAVALIRAIRECPTCDPPRSLCVVHAMQVTALYPEPCPDPTCYACNMTRENP